MTFFTIVVRGLLRRPVRTALTLVGISIGIAAVVTLVGISRGFEQSWANGMKARGTDIVVSNMGSALAPKPFAAGVRDRIASLPNVCRHLRHLRGSHEHRRLLDDGRLGPRVGRISVAEPQADLRTDAARRDGAGRRAGPDSRGGAEEKSRRPAHDRGEGIVRGRHRGWRRAGGERLGDSLAAALPGNHGKRGQDQHRGHPRRSRNERKRREAALRADQQRRAGSARHAGWRARRQQRGVPFHPRDELGHLAARGDRRRASAS